MNDEGRREISEWVTLLALLLALTLAPLPFVTEDRYFRVLPASLALIFPLIMLLGTMFPRGLRLPLGRWTLRIAPPAAAFVTYYSARRWRENVCSNAAAIPDELDAIKSDQDAMFALLTRHTAEIADKIDMGADASALIAINMLLKSHLAYDAVVGAEITATTDALRKKIAQPHAATTAGIWDQGAEMGSAFAVAIGLINLRMTAFRTFADDTLPQAEKITEDIFTRAEQRNLAALAEIKAKVAEVTQPGRKGRGRRKDSGHWTDDKIRELHSEYMNRGKTPGAEFAKTHGIDKSHMHRRFRELGLPTEP